MDSEQFYMVPIRGDVTLEVEKKQSVYHDIAYSGNPHKSEIGSSTLDRILGLNPAPYAMSNLDLLGGGDELTIPSRTVKLLHPINGHIDGYQEA